MKVLSQQIHVELNYFYVQTNKPSLRQHLLLVFNYHMAKLIVEIPRMIDNHFYQGRKNSSLAGYLSGQNILFRFGLGILGFLPRR